MGATTITTVQATAAKRAITADQGRLDWFGVLCSFGCAVHCAAMPVLVSTLPSLTNLRWLADPLFHQVVAVLCGVLVARAIVPGYHQHRDSRVVMLAGVGLGLLFIAAFILPDRCCSDASHLRRVSEIGVSEIGVSEIGVSEIGSEINQQSRKIVLVSSTGGSTTKLEQFNRQGEQRTDNIGTFESDICVHSTTLTHPLLTAVELEGKLGATSAQALIQAQPYLSPIGGLFLIVAHIMNIRLRCCRRTACRT